MHGNAYIVAVQVLLPQKAGSLTWWPIKSKVQQPLLSFTVTFDINHWCPGSAVWFYPHDSSDHCLTLLSNGPLHQFFTERALTGHKVVIARGSLKKPPQSGNTTGDLLNSVLQSMSDKTCKCAFFFFVRKRENCVDFGVSFVSPHHRSEGSSEFNRPNGWHFDFGSGLLTLMSTPTIFLAKQVVIRQSGMCNIYCISLSFSRETTLKWGIRMEMINHKIS